jgi:eukaryotic-like serine/threonine-protein kinase
VISLDDLEVEGAHGRGGMGVVFRARRRSTAELVALKRFVAGPRPAIAREMALLASLSHSAIVRCHSYGVDDDGPYLIMQWLEGPSLAERLLDGPLLPVDAVRIGRRLASALRHAHARGVLHLDVKPANVILAGGSSEGATLVDFGISAGREGGLSVGDAGTPGYMSPEQGSTGNGPVGPASDVFALGALLFEALEGTPAFPGESPALRHMRACGGPRPRSSSGDALAALIEAMTAVDPEARPTLLDVIAALEDPLAVEARGAPSASGEPRPATPDSLRSGAGASRSRRRPGAKLLFVGRDVELRMLESSFDAIVDERTPRVVLIEGNAGSGKTRLVDELAQRIGARARILRVEADAVLGDSPRALLRSVLRGAAGALVIPPTFESAVTTVAAGLGLSDGTADRRTARFLGVVGGWLREDDDVELLDLRARGPLFARELTLELSRWFGVLAASPLLLCLEDLHAADRASVDLLVGALTRLREAPILLVCATRPETPNVEALLPLDPSRVPLAPLTKRAALKLGASVGLPEAEALALWERSGGSPLFFEELLHQTGGGTGLSSSLRAAVQADLALVAGAGERVVGVASVMGQRVAVSDLEALLVPEVGALALEEALDDLERRDVLRAVADRARAGPTLSFRHPLWREVAETTVAARDQAAIRGRVVELWAPRDPLGAARQAELRAEALRPLEPASATEAWGRAGDLWRIGGDAERAVHALTQTLFAGEIRWLPDLGELVALVRSGPPGLPEALEARVDATAPADVPATLDDAGLLGAARALAALSRGRGAEKALRRVREAERPEVLLAAVEIGIRRGAFAAAADAYRALHATGHAAPLRTRTFASLALAASGDGELAERVLAESRELPGASEPALRAEIAKYAVFIRLFARDYSAAAAAAERAVADAREAHLPFHEAVSLHNLGDALHRVGRHDESAQALTASQLIAERHGFDALVRGNRSHLRYLAGLAGDSDAGRSLVTEATEAEEKGALGDAVDLRCLVARLHRATGALDEARAEYRDVIVLAGRTGQSLALREAQEALAQLGE